MQNYIIKEYREPIAQWLEHCPDVAEVRGSNPLRLTKYLQSIQKMLITTNNLEQAKKEIKKTISENKELIIVKAQNPEFNRKILEYGNFNILLNPHFSQDKDKLKYPDSGINHVSAKIATKNKIAIGIDLNEIKNLEKKEKAQILAKIKQNIKICRKAKTKIKLLNYKDQRNAFSLLISLGASTQQAKDAIS